LERGTEGAVDEKIARGVLEIMWGRRLSVVKERPLWRKKKKSGMQTKNTG